MEAAVSGSDAAAVGRPELGPGKKAAVAAACVVCGFLPVAAGYIPSSLARFAYGLVVTLALLGLALLARRSSALSRYWELPLALFGLALFWLGDQYVPGLLRSHVLGEGATSGDPIASTVSGTLIIQLSELLLTVVVVLVVLWIARASLSSIYVRWGRFGRAYVIGAIGLLAFYVLTYRILQHSRLLPVHGVIDLDRYLRLTPALLLLVGMNAFLEELTFRGLLMSRLNLVLGPYLATVVQAVVFASWHLGITYTPFLLIFVVFFIFPLGVLTGYLTRSSGSILASWLFHMGADIPIYLGFLSYVS